MEPYNYFWVLTQEKHNLKRILSLALLLVFIIATFAGCTTEAGESTVSSGESSQIVTETPEASTEDEAVAEDSTDNGEIVEINMLVVDESSVSEKLDGVEEAINEITEDLINVHVNLTYVEFGAYANQITMSISSGDQLDLAILIPSPSASFSTLYSMGGLSDITDELQNTELLDVVGDYIKATTIDGKVYGVPAYRMLASSQYIIMRKDVLEDIGMLEKAEGMTTWAEYEEILEAVRVSDWELSPYGSNSKGRTAYCDADDFSDTVVVDDAADSLGMIAVNLDDPNATVYNFYESDVYYRMLERMKKWYDSGWYWKDSAISTESGDALIKNNTIFSYIITSEYGTEEVRKASTGYDCVCIPITPIPIATSTCTKFVWTVPSTVVEKEAAVKMLNLMYTNSDIVNTFAWGVEGSDYVETENGVAYYPDGITDQNVNYHTYDYLYGNQFLVLPWGEDADPDLRKTQSQIMDEAQLSPYLGFSCETTSISNEIAACNSVISEYRAAIQSGSVDLSMYDTFVQMLKEAGADTIVEEYQNQLDAWLENNAGA